jgi:hypothetical protein
LICWVIIYNWLCFVLHFNCFIHENLFILLCWQNCFINQFKFQCSVSIFTHILPITVVN